MTTRVVDEPPAPEPTALAGLRAAIDLLASLDGESLADRGTVAEVAAQLARLESVACRQAEAVRRQRQWFRDGATTAAAWIAGRCRSPKTVADRRVRLGRALPQLDHVAGAFAGGEISLDHVDVLVRAFRHSDTAARAFRRDEAMLVDWAQTLRFGEFRRRVDEWILAAAPDAADDHAARQRSQRRLHLSQSFDNLWFADAVLDPLSGEIVHNALRAITDELFAADWAAAKAFLGADPTGDELARLTRTPAQRRSDALVEMATRAMAAPVNGRRPQPLFTVLVGEDTFRRVCELASGTVVAPGSLTSWLTDAVIERIVFDGPDRVLSVGRRRAFTGALRRAIEVTGRRCAGADCDHAAHHCEIDHIEPWALGGPTTQANGRLLCGPHNRRRPHSQRPGGADGPATGPDRPGGRQDTGDPG